MKNRKLCFPADYLQDHRDAGVQVHRFHSNARCGKPLPAEFRITVKSWWLTVPVLVGSSILAMKYLTVHPATGPWRDTHLLIEGPAAVALQLLFK